MRILKKLIVVAGLQVCSLACSAQTISASFAKCETEAYSILGVETDNRATVDYLEKKYEIVRVCMLRNGYKFKPYDYGYKRRVIAEHVYKKYGIWTESGTSEKYQRYIYEANREIDRLAIIDRISSANWQ